jgi:pimeloyl-ACP methyl ester carboxylesterase
MKPVLLLIPGMLNTPVVWAKVVPLLQDVADVRILNVQTQTSIGEMADDALAMVADMPDEQPLVVCGFSMGGLVAIELIAARAHKIRAVCLLDTSGRPESPESAVQREKTIAALARDFDKTTLGIARFFCTGLAGQQNAVLMDEILAAMRPVGPDAAIAQNRAIMARSDHRAALARLDMPVLVLCGKDDLVTPPECSEELAALIPGAQLKWIESSGHMVPMEQPTTLADQLKKFIAHVL